MRGKLYSVGIGPGDPELMTLKAVRLLKECDVVALPKGDGDIMTAKNIVNQIVNIDEKEQVVIYMPMTKDKDALAKAHQGRCRYHYQTFGRRQKRGVYHAWLPDCLRYLHLCA